MNAFTGRRGSAMDVWQGTADEGVASNGDILRRLPNGAIERTSAQHGYKEIMQPEGQQGAGMPFGLVPFNAGQPAPAQNPGAPVQSPGGAPAPAQRAGGGFLDGLRNLFDGGQGQRVNDTVRWLGEQGFDANTSRALAANPPLLQEYLRYHMGQNGPAGQARQAEMTRNAQFLVQNGYSPDEARIIASDGPSFTAALKGIQEGRKPGEGFTLSEGQTRYGPDGSVIAASPRGEQSRPMTTPEERQKWGIPAEDTRPFAMTPEGPKLIGGSGVTVNNTVDAKGEAAWETESAKLWAKRYDDLSAGAMNAEGMLGMYDLAERALDTDVRTGIGAEAELTLRQLGAAIGIDTDEKKVAAGELIRSIQNRMALLMRSPDGGMGMPGALSDRDIKFLKASQIGIDRTREGNRAMLEAFRLMERRKIEIARLADDYIQTNGRLDHGFNKLVRDFAQQNPLFPEAGEPTPDAAGQDAGGASQRAVNPETGEVLEWDGSQWRPVQPTVPQQIAPPSISPEPSYRSGRRQ